MNRQTATGIGGCALAILLLPAAISAKKPKFRTCGNKPLPLQLRPFTNKPQRIDSLCRNTGCFKGAANDKQNAMKNNFCAPTNKIIPVTLQTFVDLRDAASSNASITIGEPPPRRAQLANMIKLRDGTRMGEGKTVVFVGYVLDARHSNVDEDDPLNRGNGESVQCNLLGCAYNDIHIDLTADRNDRTPCHSIVAEIIPHYRPPSWELFDSPDYAAFLKTHPVKITGQLFYDDSHVACTKDGQAGFNPRNNAKDFERLALWEIHPIYAIDVCRNTDRSQCNEAAASAWFPFTDLQSRLGLASVTATEKCKATTDNPKSACPGFTGSAKKHHPAAANSRSKTGRRTR